VKRRCLTPGCTRTTTATRCPACEYQHRARYRGTWPTLARQAIARHPYCAECGSTHDLTADHVAGGGRLDEGITVLCRSCNSRKAATTDRRRALAQQRRQP
jgi:5-methylcytosine-specific restriction endonuclease McrA